MAEIILKSNLMIFPNENKSDDKSPDGIVRAKIHGEFVEVGSAWKRKTAKNTPFWSISVVNHHLKEIILESEATSDGKPQPKFDNF